MVVQDRTLRAVSALPLVPAMVPALRQRKGVPMTQSLSVEELREATVALIRAAEQDSVADWPQGVDYSHLDRAWAALDATYPVIWTDEQVAGVQAWQECGWVHPLTCANHNDNWHRDEDGEEVLPIALPQGLVCRSCGYRQFQVPPMCFEGSPPNPAEALRSRSPLEDNRNG